MAHNQTKTLGLPFDIHSGGMDLVYSTDSVSTSVFNIDIVFTNECGEQIQTIVPMLSLPPTAEAIPSLVYCEFETMLQAF